MNQEKEMSITEKSQPIAVLALNPAVDITYVVPQLLADQKVTATKTYYHPGGNGINVARTLAELGVPVRCCSVIGGQGGEMFLRLLGDSLGDGHHYVEVNGETRINSTLLQKQPRSQYEVDSGGPTIPAQVLERIIDCFLENCTDSIAVLTGSTPPGVPDTTYAELIEAIRGQGGSVVLDAHGRVLKNALEAKPYLLRTNRYVLEMTVKQRLKSIEAVAQAARKIQLSGTEYVCISLGKKGAVLVDSHGSFHCTAPKVRVYSTVGCGDAMVAGMITARLQGKNSRDMVRFGVICGSATASHTGTELLTRDEVEETEYDLDIRTLEI